MVKYIAFIAVVFCAAIAVFISGLVLITPVAVSILVAAIISDTVTTKLCLNKSGREGNPVVAVLFKRLGYKGTLALWTAVWGLIIYFRILPADNATQTAIGIAYWLVPLNNLWVLRRLTRAKATQGGT